MTTYALIRDGVVADVIPPHPSGAALEDCFAPEIVAACVALKGAQVTNVRSGYTYDGSSFSAPVAPEPVAVAEPTKAELLAQIAALMAKVEALPDDAA